MFKGVEDKQQGGGMLLATVCRKPVCTSWRSAPSAEPQLPQSSQKRGRRARCGQKGEQWS